MNKDSFLVSRGGSGLKEHRLLGITSMELYHRANTSQKGVSWKLLEKLLTALEIPEALW